MNQTIGQMIDAKLNAGQIAEERMRLIVAEVLIAVNEDEILTINQVAKILKCSHSTVKAMIEKGVLRATKDNKITRRDLNIYLNKYESFKPLKPMQEP